MRAIVQRVNHASLSVDGREVSARQVLYWLAYTCDYIAAACDGGIQWEDTVDGADLETYARDQAVRSAALYATVENWAEDCGCALTDEDRSAMDREWAARAAQYGGEDAYLAELARMGLDRSGAEAISRDYYLYRQLYDLFRTEGSALYPAQEDLETFAREQGEKFDWFDRELKKMGIQVEIRHLDNSAGIVNFSSHYEMVRAGIVMYGMAPSSEVDCTALGLRPALSWHSYVSHVKSLEPGRRIGYGGTFVTTRQTRVATVPAGYADGYRRSLSNGFHVLIRGKKAPILGKICMDQMMVDVTDIPGVQVDDPVVLVGRDGNEEITMEEIGEQAGSFHYEFVCGISRRVPRIYFQKGRQQEQVHYLLVNG